MDIVYQLRSKQAQLSPTERRIADACLKDVAFAASATIDQLAVRAKVSRSALSRFAKTVGCKDIRELRMQLAQAGAVGSRFFGQLPAVESAPEFASTAASPLPSDADPARQPHPTNAPKLAYDAIAADITLALQRHLEVFDAAVFRQAAAMLAESAMVYAYGMGGASTMGATEIQHRLVRLGKPVAAYQDPVLMRMASAAVAPSHVVVALSLSGITPELLEAVAIAKRYGARIVAITPASSALGMLADLTLPMVVAETDFIYKPTAARYGMLLGIDILATELALLAPLPNQERLRRVKLALDEYRQGSERLPLGD